MSVEANNICYDLLSFDFFQTMQKAVWLFVGVQTILAFVRKSSKVRLTGLAASNALGDISDIVA